LSFLSPLKQRLRHLHRVTTFAYAWQRFRRDPASALSPESPLVPQLIYGWGNEGWSGDEEFLRACVAQALIATDPIVECGSGLSTLLVGAVAARRSVSVLSLEHLPDWQDRVNQVLRQADIAAAHVVHSPLVDYGDFLWYELPSVLPERIGLVICDGPPAETPGGRYGMLPLLRSRLAPGSVLLLDDAERQGEQAIAKRWADALGCKPRLDGLRKPFYVFTLPPSQPVDSAHAAARYGTPAPRRQ
jgi:predicted O-methyltransferase YrrM